MTATVVIVAALTVVFSLFLAVARPSNAGNRSWALVALGLLAIAVRTPETLLVSVLLGNTLLAAGWALYVGSYRRFSGLRFPLERVFYAALPVLVAALVWLTLERDLVAARAGLVNGYCALAMLAVVGLCAHGAVRQPRLRAGFVLSAGTFFLSAATAFLRAAALFTVPALSVAEAATSNVLLYVVVLLLTTTCSFAMLVLHDDRRRLEVADLQAELRALVETDPLTGARNRRGLEARFASDTAHGARLSLAVLDVDHFKLVNDRFGHEVGDRCLEHLGRFLLSATRGVDCVALYGGEEFVLLLPGLDKAAAAEVLRRLQHELAASFGAGEGLPAFTLSAGVAERRFDESFDGLFQQADRALYRAKAGGRNAVCCDEPVSGLVLSL